MLHLETLFNVTSNPFLIGSIWLRFKPGSPKRGEKMLPTSDFLDPMNERTDRKSNAQKD